MVRLCRIIASALTIRANPESIRNLIGVHRVGFIMPEPGIRYPAYLVTRSNSQSYAETLGALVASQGGKPFSMLVPTGRFLTEDMEREARTVGASIVVLADVTLLTDDRLSCRADPAALFSSLGQRTSAIFEGVGEVVAQALVCNGESPPHWQDLDEPAYRALVADASSFDVFADEQTKTVQTGPVGARQTNTTTASHFSSVRLAVTKRGYFDPFQADPLERASAQQIFQRARRLFDPRIKGGSWRVFKTVQVEGRFLYHFSPDPGTTFAFVFLPET
jgi:hypothetical protein